MPDTVKIPLDQAVVPLALKPGEEIVIKGQLYSTEDGSRIDARATSWPGSAPGGASVDVGGYIDFAGGGLRVESYDPATHEVHARAMAQGGEVCSAAGKGTFCLPARTLVQAQSRGLTVAQWKGSLQGELSMEIPTPPPLAPVTSVLASPVVLGGAFTVVVVGALVAARKARKRWSETPTAQLEALAKRVRERARTADVALGAPLLPALDRALEAFKRGKIDAASPEGKRMEAMLLRVEDKLSRTERTLRAEDEKAVADDLLHDVEDALDAGDEALEVVRGRMRLARLERRGEGSRSEVARDGDTVARMYDLKIVGGTLVDGKGGAPRTGDVGIVGDKIVALGDCDGPAQRTIDAHGAHVLPGFVDVHTHYDGQISWDAEISPSSSHGVTTVVLGSCGVGFAPVRPGREDKLVELMEGVEDIPGSALAEGIPWGWESFADYMRIIGAMPHAIDFLVQVPHDPLRMYVMGERAVADEVATDDDIEAMRKLLHQALRDGAAGFSTGRSDNHRTARGAATPASEVDARELTGLARAFVGLKHGVLQAVSDFDMMRGPERFDPEFDLLEQMVAASGGRPLSISTMQRDHAPDQWRQILARADAAVAKGLDVRCQVGARGIGVLVGLEATFHPFMGYPSYKAIANLPLAERVAQMRDPEVRQRMLAEKTEKVAGDGTPIPPLVDFFLENINMVAMRLYPLAETPDYEPTMMQCLAAEAADRNVSVLARIYDRLIEDDGKALLYFPVYNYTGFSLDVVREMLVHPRALMGLGDGGAHVGTVCDASMPTYLLTHWARDRKNGIPLERVVQMQCHDTARFMGLHDRGTLEIGKRADLNVIDLPNLRLDRPKMQRDLPAGGKRLFQRATGYLATLVGGTVIAENGALNGARPGKLVKLHS